MGGWKNYNELEESLTLEELMLTVKTMRDKENSEREFSASLQGVEMNGSLESYSQARDITTLSGREAARAGYGIGIDLGYERIGFDE